LPLDNANVLRRFKPTDNREIIDRTMTNPIRVLADEALFAVNSRVGAGPDLGGRFLRALKMHTNGDSAVFDTVIEALKRAGYTLHDFQDVGGWDNFQAAVQAARKLLQAP